MRCPLQHFFRDLLRLPERSTSGPLALGSAVHQALARFHRSVQQGRPIPPPAVRDAFLASWKERLVVAPQRGEPLVAKYRNPDKLLASIPFAEKLKSLPRLPFVGELSFRDIIDVLKRQRRFFTAPERKLIDLTSQYLEYKIATISRSAGS